MSASLRSLRDRPFELLLELDRRLRAQRAQAGSGDADLWQGLAFRNGAQWWVAPREDVREVIQPPRLTRVPNAQPWLPGVANVRGALLTLVDLRRLFGTGEGEISRTTRVLVLNSERQPLGFLVDEVAGYRHFSAREQADAALPPQDPAAACVLGAFAREGRSWRVLSLHRLAQSATLRRAGW